MSRRTLFPSIAAVAVLLVVMVFTSCDPPPPRPTTLDRAPNPDSGYKFLLTRIYGQSFGLTLAALDTIWTVWPPELREIAEKATPEVRKKMTYDRYGMLEGVDDMPGRSKDVPLNFNADSVGQLYTNCLLCHAGKVDGTVIQGMNNHHIAVQTLQTDAITLLIDTALRARGIGAEGVDEKPHDLRSLAEAVAEERKNPRPEGLVEDVLSPIIKRFLDEIADDLVLDLTNFLEQDNRTKDALLDSLLGDGPITDLIEKYIEYKLPVWSNSDGTSNAFYVAAQWGTFRNRPIDLKKLPVRKLPPLDQWATEAPSWFNSHKKKLYYRDGFIEDRPGDLMQFVMSANNPGDSIRSWYPNFQDLLAWIKSLEVPKWKQSLPPINQDLAKRGMLIFTNNCAQCHGYYGAGEGNYFETWYDQEIIRTDPARLYGMGRVYREFLKVSFFGEDGTGPSPPGRPAQAITVFQPPGYIAPPLDGIWATPPYFHNGSSPTLWHVLHPRERPKVWFRSEDGYDPVRVGLVFDEFDVLPDSAVAGWQKRMYFQDTLPGKSIQGHYFGASLSNDEKMALIEYLKSI